MKKARGLCEKGENRSFTKRGALCSCPLRGNGITVEMLRIAFSHMQHGGAEKLQLRAVSLQKDKMIAVYKVFDTEQVHRVIPANSGGERMIDGALQKVKNGFLPRGAQL